MCVKIASTTRQSAKQKGQRRERPTTDQLLPEMRDDFKKGGLVAINAKRFTATLKPFENINPADAQHLVDQAFPGTPIRLAVKEPYYENVRD